MLIIIASHLKYHFIHTMQHLLLVIGSEIFFLSILPSLRHTARRMTASVNCAIPVVWDSQKPLGDWRGLKRSTHFLRMFLFERSIAGSETQSRDAYNVRRVSVRSALRLVSIAAVPLRRSSNEKTLFMIQRLCLSAYNRFITSHSSPVYALFSLPLFMHEF